MFIKRDIEDRLKSLVKQFAAVALLGPRQSGKTTLAKNYLMSTSIFLLKRLATGN